MQWQVPVCVCVGRGGRKERKRMFEIASCVYPRELGLCVPAAYGSSVDGNVAKYSKARWIAGGIGGGVGKWSP